MTRSAKLGITSIFLLLSTLIPTFLNWQFPIAFVCAVLSILFGLLAAQQGSRWWLTVPGLIVAGISILWWNGARAF